MASIKQLRKNDHSEKLKKFRNAASNSFQDDRFWKPPFDKEKGAGYAVIRFLPEPPNEDFPWVKMFSHFFRGPSGQIYSENSLTTVGQQDPVSDLNSRLWNSGIESDKEIARAQKRGLRYYSNILVIEDPERPENEGKVFLFGYGPQIFTHIEEAMNPKFPNVPAIVPSDVDEGANFVMMIQGKKLNKTMVPNYEKCYFDVQNRGPLADSDDEIERIWNECYSLEELVNESKFKSYKELQNRLFQVLGPSVGTVKTVEEPESLGSATGTQPASNSEPAKKTSTTEPPADDAPPWAKDEDEKKDEPSASNVDSQDDDDEEDDDDAAFFRSMANS